MAHHEDERTTLDGVLNMLVENGLDGMAEAMATMLNEAMKIERSTALRAEPGERSCERLAYANGFKPKRVASRAGSLDLRVPQVRWSRVRRRAAKQAVRPLPLHSARHSWATRAIQAGKNVRWVADQLGHADPSTTLTHWAHAMREDEEDLSFLDLGGARRRYTATAAEIPDVSEGAVANHSELMEEFGARDRVRTGDPQLGKLMLYQLSYSRIRRRI